MATLPVTQAVDEAPGMIATVAQVDAWLEHAKYGDVFVYVTGTCLPIRSGGAARMRDLAARGLVHLTQKRVAPGAAMTNYRAQRSNKPSALSKPTRSTLSIDKAELVDDEATLVNSLLPLLARAAKHGRPCPTDAQLAERAMLRRDDIAPALEVLRAAGLIHIQSAPAPTLRRVTILATGERTGLAA